MRSVCTRGNEQIPVDVSYKHKSCLSYLRKAQKQVVSSVCKTNGYKFDSDKGLTETFNQAAREYKTVLDNNVWMNFTSWQVKLVSAELELITRPLSKPSKRFVTKKILQIVNCAKQGPNPNNYNSHKVITEAVPFLDSDECKIIISRLKHFLRFVPDIEPGKRDDWYGITNEFYIKKYISTFLQVGVFMVNRIIEIRDCMSECMKLPRIPTVIPQMTFKVRSITFGKEQIVELARYITVKGKKGYGLLLEKHEIPSKKSIVEYDIKKNSKRIRGYDGIVNQFQIENEQPRKRVRTEVKLNSDRTKLKKMNFSNTNRDVTDISKLTLEQWRHVSGLIFKRIFTPPKRCKEVTVVTTDGISASWHVHRQVEVKKGKQNKTKKTIRMNVTSTKPGQYGTHGSDTIFNTDKNTTVISVDPGHANIISLIRKHPEPKLDSTTRQGRMGISKFELSNSKWRDMNGNHQYNQRIMFQTSIKLQGVIDDLSKCSSSNLNNYEKHIEGRMGTSAKFIEVMKSRNNRRWKFEAYQKEQRAVHKLVADVLDGVDSKENVVVAWGNGSFGPTSRGHDSAPNKKLRRSLSHYVPIVLIDEYNTSKKSCCCKSDCTELRTKGYMRRATVMQCVDCRCILSRDTNASCNINEVFMFQVENQTHQTPPYLRRKKLKDTTYDA